MAIYTDERSADEPEGTFNERPKERGIACPDRRFWRWRRRRARLRMQGVDMLLRTAAAIAVATILLILLLDLSHAVDGDLGLLNADTW